MRSKTTATRPEKSSQAFLQKRVQLTTLNPWPKGALTSAYKSIAHENWDAIEAAAIRNRKAPSFND